MKPISCGSGGAMCDALPWAGLLNGGPADAIAPGGVGTARRPGGAKSQAPLHFYIAINWLVALRFRSQLRKCPYSPLPNTPSTAHALHGDQLGGDTVVCMR